MHILFLPSWYPLEENDLNGCFFREQAHALSRSGYKIGVIMPQFRSLRMGGRAIFGNYKTQFWLDEGIATYFKHDTFLFPKVPYIDLQRWVRKGLALFELYIKEQGMPKVIHVQSMVLAGPLALAIHKKYNIPYCIMEHSSTFSRGLVKRWQYQYMAEVVQNSSYCLAVSIDLATLLSKVFENSTWSFSPNLLNNLFLNRHESIDKNTNQFCSVANLNKNKGFDVLLQAFALVISHYPNYTLVIGGDGPEKSALQQLAKDIHIDKSVSFKGAISREDVRDLMGGSFCYVLSSHIETFGVVVIEALSQGIPVVATRCGGPESIITPVDGLLVEVNNEKDLADGMIKIIKNCHDFDSLTIRENCINRFSEKAFVSNMSKVYEHCTIGRYDA